MGEPSCFDNMEQGASLYLYRDELETKTRENFSLNGSIDKELLSLTQITI
jgi:hypothetical protein